MDPVFINFLNNLEHRERLFYLLMKAYEQELNMSKLYSEATTDSVKQLYETEIMEVLKKDQSPPLPRSLPQPLKRLEDKDEFEDILGGWASSFSE